MRTGILIVAAGLCGVVAAVAWRDSASLRRARAARANREHESSSSSEIVVAPTLDEATHPASGAMEGRGELSQQPPVPLAPKPETADPPVEPKAPPSPPPEVLAPPERREAQAVRRAVDLAMIRNPGASVAFTDCAEDPCMTRLKSADPRVLHAVASDVSDAYDGHARIVLREHLDGFLGRWFEADVTVGTPEATPVPSLESELPGAVASLPRASATSN
ncbi:MAG: hypothetical protein JWM82_1097 [Myxococcales bacterium]|nr:hypothetical protein [Myxococcales bacterium]